MLSISTKINTYFQYLCLFSSAPTISILEEIYEMLTLTPLLEGYTTYVFISQHQLPVRVNCTFIYPRPYRLAK